MVRKIRFKKRRFSKKRGSKKTKRFSKKRSFKKFTKKVERVINKQAELKYVTAQGIDNQIVNQFGYFCARFQPTVQAFMNVFGYTYETGMGNH